MTKKYVVQVIGSVLKRPPPLDDLPETWGPDSLTQDQEQTENYKDAIARIRASRFYPTKEPS